MLKNGQIIKDWTPKRIGGAIKPGMPTQGEGMDAIQAALLAKPPGPPPVPVKVPMQANVERLAQLLGRPPLGTIKPLKLFHNT